MSHPGPNPQLNLALSIVAPVIALITVAVLWFTKPVITTPTAPTAVNTTAAKLPDGGTVFANALPNAGAAPAGGGAGGGMGMPGGPPPGLGAAGMGGGGGGMGGGRSGKPMPRGAG
jgi:uncharacterized membrane protein YgcG